MAYDTFSEKGVFINFNVNALCNRLYQFVIDANTIAAVNAGFCITGTVAKIIQGASVTAVEVVAFATDDQDIFDYCLQELADDLNGQVIRLTDRVLLTFPEVYIEIWFIANLGTINEVNELKVQNTNDIPNYIS